MTTNTLRGMLCIALGALMSSLVVAAVPKSLTDAQLDGVYAAGLDIRVDLDVDVAGSKPGAILIDDGGAAAMRQYYSSGTTLAHSIVGSRNSASLDPSGTYTPTLQNLTSSSISLATGALQNATTLMNIFSLGGDLNVGLNFNVIVNPVNSPINLTQTNINSSTLHIDPLSTLGTTLGN